MDSVETEEGKLSHYPCSFKYLWKIENSAILIENNTEQIKNHNANRLDEDDTSLELLHAKISELEKNGTQEEKEDKKIGKININFVVDMKAKQNKKQMQEFKQFLTDTMNDNSNKEDKIKEITSKFFQMVC